MRKLNGTQYQQLRDALLEAFPSPNKLAQMLRLGLDKHLARIAMGDDLSDVVFKVIETAEAEGWTAELIAAAREYNPKNPFLLAFAQQFNLAIATPARPELEQLIKKTQSFLDINRWRERLGEIEQRVCQIELPLAVGTVTGTGFLVAPDVVMTNYHVVEELVANPTSELAKQLIVRFDYKCLADGTTVNPGKIYTLATADCLLDVSPYAANNTAVTPETLDYALLRLAAAAGDEMLGYTTRGWIEVPEPLPAVHEKMPLFIVQHPEGEPLKLAFDTEAVTEVLDDGATLHYCTNTLPGSSGSPCFNAHWEWVGLHHSGDPAFAHRYNAGSSIQAIMALLTDRGLRSLLGKPQL